MCREVITMMATITTCPSAMATTAVSAAGWRSIQRQRQKLIEFAELCGEENTPLHKSFFDRAKEFFR